MSFDPNAAAGADAGIFGLPFTEQESQLILLPIPWEATTSYGGGTVDGPRSILHASKQVDLFDVELGKVYEAGFFMLPEEKKIRQWNKEGREKAARIIAKGGDIKGDKKLEAALQDVNALSGKLNEYVYATVKKYLDAGKRVGMVGGDHSTPFGGVLALLEKHPSLGILHIDAHADMRRAFEGFEHSHASIFYNLLTKLPLKISVHVGLRDLCEEEYDFMQTEKKRVAVFFDHDLRERKYRGETWQKICREIVGALPKEVYVSFDIDGLDPSLCPHTGTPVPGGLSFGEADFLLKTLVESGKTIVGFDLNEVSPGPDEWDGNVGARILYKLCGWMVRSQGK